MPQTNLCGETMETFNEHENHNKLLDLIAEMALHNLELSFEHKETTTLTTIKQSP